jgi:hypothetical protein
LLERQIQTDMARLDFSCSVDCRASHSTNGRYPSQSAPWMPGGPLSESTRSSP